MDEDGFRFWRLKSDIAADSLGTSLPGEDELLIPAEMLTRAAKSALQKKKKMLLLKKSRCGQPRTRRFSNPCRIADYCLFC